MKLLVCVKQVADQESRFKPDAKGLWYDEADLAFRMNEYDEYAVEEAVKLREKLGEGSDLTVLSVGPDRVVEALKKALAMGCDRAVHVKDADASTKDPWQIATAIAAFAREKKFDVVFTGLQSMDRGSAQVGVIVAELLGLPCVTTLVSFEYENGVVTARRELEGGVRAKLKLALPALFTCQLGLNTPRYPTLPNIMKAKKKEIVTMPIGDLLDQGPLAATAKFYAPAKKGGGLVLEGDIAGQVDKVIALLKEKTAVLR
jgi:electron transfer flavoprotein beta subunit